MKQIYNKLETSFKIDEDKGYVADQIQNRVDSEDWYTSCKGFPLIKEVKGRLGQPKHYQVFNGDIKI